MLPTKTALIVFTFQLVYLVSAELNLQDVEIPDMDDFAAIKEKCDKLGGSGTYDTLKASKDSLQSCLQGFADFTVLQTEVEEAKKTGSMDEVFGKYCNKRPKLTSCAQNFTTALRPCLNDEEKKALNTTLDVLKQLGDFVCFRDGDRIAMFVAEGGVECIKDHTEGIKNCVNNTFKITPTVNTNSLPNLMMDKKKCDDLGKLQSCVVEELEKCQESTPANIVDALFRFIKRSACANKQKRSIHSVIRRSLAVTNNIYNTTEVLGNFYTVMKNKCKQNGPEDAFEIFSVSYENATECFKSKFAHNHVFSTPVDDFKNNIKDCLKDVVEKISACLKDEEKFWPQYEVDVLLNLVDVLYRNQDILRRPNSRSEMINCFQNFKQPSVALELKKCVAVSMDVDFTKENTCKRVKTGKNCITEQYHKRCIREITTTKLLDEIFDSLLAPPCDKD